MNGDFFNSITPEGGCKNDVHGVKNIIFAVIVASWKIVMSIVKPSKKINLLLVSIQQCF